MKTSLELGKVSGIKVSVHWTFLILLAWIVLINVRAGTDAVHIVWSLLFILSIFVCVVLHELGHALMARRFNISTRDITLYPIGGVARLDSIPKKPKEELLVALAGPAVNFVISFLLFPFVDFSGVKDATALSQIGAENFLLAFVTVNIWLAIFNLIPAFPMDGGRVFRALLSFKLSRPQATRIAASVGQIIAIGFIFLGFYINPFMIFIGLFIFLGAQSEANYAQTEALLDGKTLKRITMREFPTLDSDVLLHQAVTETLNSQKKNFVILSDSKIVGTLGQPEMIKALREHGEQVKVSEVMDKDILYLPITLPIEQALLNMQRETKSMAVVMLDGEAVGIVDNDNLVEFIVIQGARKQYEEHN
jgi:Zn-dependent protease/predicted transcriptional regulator